MKRQKPKGFDLSNRKVQFAYSNEASTRLATASPPSPFDLNPAQMVAGDGAMLRPQADTSDLPQLGPPDHGGHPASPALVSATSYYLVAFVVSCLVATTPVLFAWSYQRDLVPFRDDTFSLCMIALLSIGPAALVWLTAFVLHQTAKMAAEARRAQALTDQLTQPAALAARGAGSAAEAVRLEIEHATAVAVRARTELLSLREVLASESQRLVEATEGSGRTATNLTRELSTERERMTLLGASLDSQAAAVADAIGRHARMVAEASDLAETQLREAEASLTARAADLAAAAGEASDAARIASEDLSRQVARLETASQGVGDQTRLLEDGLTVQRAGLVTIAHSLRADHEVFAADAETQLARLHEVVVHAREGASELAETAARGADGLGRLITSAGEQLANIIEAAAHERDLLSASAAQSLGAVSEIAAHERQAMEDRAQATIGNIATAAERAGREVEAHARAIADEHEQLGAASAQSLTIISQAATREREQLELQARQTIDAVVAAANDARQAMESHAETARDKVDQLSEASFAAGQRAEAVFENRLSEARSLIEQSARLIDDAGAASAVRLSEGVQSARATLSELEDLLSNVDARIARLPADAQARAETVRESIERGMDELLNSARRAAEETQAIDAAFQDRVRRNYDMLSEAVRLMGVVAGGAPRATAAAPAPLGPRAAPPPLDIRSEARSEAREVPRMLEQRPPAPRPAEAAPSEPRAVEIRPVELRAAASQLYPPQPEPISTADAGLRPRLRLTPTASDEEFKQVFEAAGGREAPKGEPGPSTGEGWTWKELLSSMDDEPVVDETQLAERVLGEVEIMGIDAGALLPRSRIEDLAAAAQTGQADAMRVMVHRLAPAAIRRLTRRLMSDRDFRSQTDRFVQRYQALIDDSVGRPDNGVVLSALLASDQGRAYLLFDAALHDSL